MKILIYRINQKNKIKINVKIFVIILPFLFFTFRYVLKIVVRVLF